MQNRGTHPVNQAGPGPIVMLPMQYDNRHFGEVGCMSNSRMECVEKDAPDIIRHVETQGCDMKAILTVAAECSKQS